MPRTLSKSDFKTARTCPAKLYYKELGYPTTFDSDPYLRLLSDGGYMVEQIAKLQYPDGIAIDYAGTGAQAAAERTIEMLRASENVVLFEATLLSGSKLARTDILVKRGADFDLLEVKAKLWKGPDDSCAPFRGKRGGIASEWKRYLEDVTFQTMVLEELFPEAVVHPYLVMCDKARTTSIDELHSLFTIRRLTIEGSPIDHVDVRFLGDASSLRRDNFLATIPVDREVRDLMPAVRTASDEFAQSVTPELLRIPTPISPSCKSCEYRASRTDPRDGFMDCWGPLGAVEPSILELYKLGAPGGGTREAGRLIESRQTCLLDVDEDALANADGKIGADAQRQRIQVGCARFNIEWVSDRLMAVLDGLQYPLHFIDFETSRLAIPYHSGMHPYGMVAFQWSCHTIREPGGPIEHAAWLNSERVFPNFEFASSLRDAIGGGGSVLTWATHESTTLKEIRAAMDERRHGDDELAAWITALRAGEDGRIVDMHEITLGHYCHPMMKGSTSIKSVLAAVWSADALVRELFPEYGSGVDSPYAALPDIEIGGRPLRVAEGTEAMRAYQDMMYGAGRLDPDAKRRYAALLAQYCRLDTAAMVMIWDHWRRVAR